MKKLVHQKRWPLIICFVVPTFIMACYFAYRNMSPFGNQSILTVDLGQQYVDLFTYFRHTILNDPSGIFYSFAKAFGGEMFGTWTYYLLSPINLLLLLFPTKSLPAGILIITLIKYGLSGLSFGYLLTKTIHPNSALMIMWSTIYALNGWIIANQLNIMWLDGMIWLPLIILGINQIFNNGHVMTYIISMTAAIITNYYMAYMIFLFTVIYISFKFIATPISLHQLEQNIQKLLMSISAIFGLTVWLTLPTLFSLTQGKGHYTRIHFANHFEYLPFKMLSKLFNGSLNFNQLPTGLPNIFIGSVAVISFMIYFFQYKFTVRKRINTLIVTLILLLSLCYQPLDLLWHAGQFPVWYPYRFSFIVCFWIIWIAANAINGRYQMNWISSGIVAIELSILIVYVFRNLTDFSFIAPLNFVVGIMFLLISFILLIYTHNNSRIFSISLLIISILEMSLNAFNSLNNLNYISNASYINYTRELSKNVNWIDHQSKPPFRIGKTFYRSKDDPFSNHYFGGDTFDSSLEFTTPKFMKEIGQPEGRGFVTYSNGTLLSDQLLGYQYFLTSNGSSFTTSNDHRPDLKSYSVVHKINHYQIHKNTDGLPLVFPTSTKAFHIKLTNNSIINQGRWYRVITDRNNVKFIHSHFNKCHLVNLKISANEFRTKDPVRPGVISLTLKPRRRYVYYLLISPKINPRNFFVTQNGHELLPRTSYDHPIIINLTSGKSNRPIKITLKLLQHRLDLTPLKLYRLNLDKVKALNNNKVNVHFINNRQIKGQINTNPKYFAIGTSIPATKGWHLSIDGHAHKIHKIANEFIGAKVSPGQHRFQLTFIPPLLPLGTLITLLTIIVIISVLIWHRHVNKKTDYY